MKYKAVDATSGAVLRKSNKVDLELKTVHSAETTKKRRSRGERHGGDSSDGKGDFGSGTSSDDRASAEKMAREAVSDGGGPASRVRPKRKKYHSIIPVDESLTAKSASKRSRSRSEANSNRSDRVTSDTTLPVLSSPTKLSHDAHKSSRSRHDANSTSSDRESPRKSHSIVSPSHGPPTVLSSADSTSNTHVSNTIDQNHPISPRANATKPNIQKPLVAASPVRPLPRARHGRISKSDVINGTAPATTVGGWHATPFQKDSHTSLSHYHTHQPNHHRRPYQCPSPPILSSGHKVVSTPNSDGPETFTSFSSESRGIVEFSSARDQCNEPSAALGEEDAGDQAAGATWKNHLDLLRSLDESEEELRRDIPTLAISPSHLARNRLAGPTVLQMLKGEKGRITDSSSSEGCGSSSGSVTAVKSKRPRHSRRPTISPVSGMQYPVLVAEDELSRTRLAEDNHSANRQANGRINGATESVEAGSGGSSSVGYLHGERDLKSPLCDHHEGC